MILSREVITSLGQSEALSPESGSGPRHPKVPGVTAHPWCVTFFSATPVQLKAVALRKRSPCSRAAWGTGCLPMMLGIRKQQHRSIRKEWKWRKTLQALHTVFTCLPFQDKCLQSLAISKQEKTQKSWPCWCWDLLPWCLFPVVEQKEASLPA